MSSNKMPSIARVPLQLQAAIVLGVLVAPVAAAEDSGFYVDLGFGMANYPNHGILHIENVTITGEIDDHDDLTFRIAGGYRLNRYFAIEAGLVDLGEISPQPLSGTSGNVAAQANVSFAMKGATLAAVALLPMGNWEPYLKAGVIFSRTRLSFAGDVGGRPVSGSIRGRSEDGFFALGTGYDLNEHWRPTLEWVYFHDVGERHESGASNANAITLGLTYSF